MSRRVCPNCHSPVREQAQYCPECGNRLPPPATGETIAMPAIQRPAPGQPPRGQPPARRPATPPIGSQPPDDALPTQRGAPLPPRRPVDDAPTYEQPGPAPRRFGDTAELPRQPRSARQAPPPPPQPRDYDQYRDYQRGQYPAAQDDDYYYDDYEEPRHRSLVLPIVLGIVLLALAGAAAFFFFVLNSSDEQAGAPPAATAPVADRLPTVTPDGVTAPGGSDEQPEPGRQLLIDDDFSRQPDDGSGWPDQEVQAGSFHYRDGAYQIVVAQQAQILWTSTTERYDELDLAIDATLLEGPEADSAYGLVFRDQGQSHFYTFQIRPDGTYAFRISQGDGQWRNLLEWERAEPILQGLNQTNRLRVVARGNVFELYVNDTLINTVVDDTFAEGFIGFGVSTFEEGGAVVAFDNLELRTP